MNDEKEQIRRTWMNMCVDQYTSGRYDTKVLYRIYEN